MSLFSEFFLSSRSSVVQLELIEVTHPNFTQEFRIVRNARDGVAVDLSPTDQDVSFTYYPARVEQLGARDDLDAAIRVDIGDLGEEVAVQMDAVAEANGFSTRPSVRYWTFRSDQLSAPMVGPIELEVPTISFAAEGASFEARAPTLNSTKTGRRYTLEAFPMLRGFV